MFEDKIAVLVEKVAGDFEPKAIIVFGSVAKGTATEDSDLDVAIIMETDLPWTQRVIAVRRALGRFGMALDLLVFTPEEVEAERGNPCTIVSEILSTGRVVYGTARYSRRIECPCRRGSAGCGIPQGEGRRDDHSHMFSPTAVCGKKPQSAPYGIIDSLR